jgi:hypothetical protein
MTKPSKEESAAIEREIQMQAEKRRVRKAVNPERHYAG